jgi:predicted nucleic acid-binding protein
MSLVLIDTSVWVDHFRTRNDTLIALMQSDLALTHPMIILELACGTPPAPRHRTLGDIGLLKRCNQATPNEVLALIEGKELFGLGCGLVDMSLLASTLITPDALLWTWDKRLAALASRFGIAFSAPLH